MTQNRSRSFTTLMGCFTVYIQYILSYTREVVERRSINIDFFERVIFVCPIPSILHFCGILLIKSGQKIELLDI